MNKKSWVVQDPTEGVCPVFESLKDVLAEADRRFYCVKTEDPKVSHTPLETPPQAEEPSS